MANMNLLDEKHITNAFISINGKETNYVSFTLEQAIAEHHTFTLKLDYDTVKKDFMANPQLLHIQ